MEPVSRRDLLKAGLFAPVAMTSSLHPFGLTMQPAKAEMEQIFASAPEESWKDVPLGIGAERERLLLDFGWRFHFGNACDPDKDFGFGIGFGGNFQKSERRFISASEITYDDSNWRPVDLPHDWAVELPFVNDPELKNKGYYPLGRRYPDTSIGWYRKVFELSEADADKRITIEFDGSYRDTMVALNGFYIGRHSGGYDPFSFDVTDFANPGGRNVLLVRVDATLCDGWFYEGAGIYRHVWLVKTHPVHVRRWGTFVASEVQPNKSVLSIHTEVNNSGPGAQNVRVISTVLDSSGKPVAKGATALASVLEWGEQTYEQKLAVSSPQLWSLEERNLYKLVTEIETEGKIVDRYETRFGIRTVKFDADQGFFLNGRPVKLRGTCNHQDHAGLGVALPDAVQYYRIRRLQEMGCNAIRTSHNPPTPELLDACDRLGMLVFDETRMMSSNPEGLGQFEDLVRRDRNRPCVFMWSMGNEENTAQTETGLHILSRMKAAAYQLDGTRPVSMAPIGAIGTGGLAVCDVKGFNYMASQVDAYHKANPDQPIMGTEVVSAVCTRGIYVTDNSLGYVGSYDPWNISGRASAEGWWKFCDERSWLSGGFIWTGFDYRGEPSPNQWPNISSQYGIIDTCGFPKDTFFYYQSWWTSKPVLHLFPHWNWPGLEGQEIAVWVNSNLDKVEMFLNGRSLGAKEMNKNSHLAWTVAYTPGVIEARGYKDGDLVLTAKRETTGAPARLVVEADREEIDADGEDVAMLAVQVQDTQGRIVPITDNRVTFSISGSGKLIGVGNGDPTDQDSDKGASRKAFSGLCMGIVQSSKSAGSIRVEVTSPGLKAASATITAKPSTLRPQAAAWEREVPVGPGITGLWRPTAGNTAIAFSLKQNGSSLTGTMEGHFWGRFTTPTPILDGSVEGSRVAFKFGGNSFQGTIYADRIEIRRMRNEAFTSSRASTQAAVSRMAVGPPPDDSDPSRSSPHQSSPDDPVILRRAER